MMSNIFSRQAKAAMTLFMLLQMITIQKSHASKYEIKGEGLLNINVKDSLWLDFYSKPDTNFPVKRIKLKKNKKKDPINEPIAIIYPHDQDKKWFNPYLKYAYIGNHWFYIQCSKANSEWYEVIVNENTNQRYWIKKSPEHFKYYSWPEFIESTYGVKPLNPEGNTILKKKSRDAEPTEKQFPHCLAPVEVSGIWLKVKIGPNRCFEYGVTEENAFEGYIRWRDKNKLLVNYSFLP